MDYLVILREPLTRQAYSLFSHCDGHRLSGRSLADRRHVKAPISASMLAVIGIGSLGQSQGLNPVQSSTFMS